MDKTLLFAMLVPLSLAIWVLLEYISYKNNKDNQ
jgi:hypothetical protein